MIGSRNRWTREAGWGGNDGSGALPFHSHKPDSWFSSLGDVVSDDTITWPSSGPKCSARLHGRERGRAPTLSRCHFTATTGRPLAQPHGAVEPPCLLHTLCSCANLFPGESLAFGHTARWSDCRKDFAVAGWYLHCKEVAFAAAYRVKGCAYASREHFGVVAGSLLGHEPGLLAPMPRW
jgi:hypothetical protein